MKRTTILLSYLFCIIFTIVAQEKPTGEFLDLFTKDVQPKAISDNGEWACGAALVDKSFTNAVKWNLTTGEPIYLQESETDPSDAYWISNDGSLIGGSYLNAPAYNLNGEWITLDMPWVSLNGGEMYGEVVAITINDGDTTCLGWVYTQTDAVLARWINGEVDEDFSDYESTNQYLTKTRINDKQSTYHQLKDMSTDGSRLLISLDWIYLPSAGLPSYITTYVQTEDTTLIIERNFDDRYEETSFVDNAVMSPNGKWVCGDFYVFPKLDSELSQGYVAFLFDVDNDSLIVFDYIKSTNKLSTATAVDDNGNVYFRSNNMNNPLGKPYIYKANEYVELESCLLAYEGINAGQIDAIITDEAAGTDEDDLGQVWCVSADGKTLVGAGGALKSNIWAARLSCSPYDVEPTVAVENVTYDKLAAYYANGIITLSGNANMIEVYSITGAKVMSQAVENSSIKANLRDGIYVVKIYNGNTVATSKIIVK